MQDSLNKLLGGYQKFRQQYIEGDSSIMQSLADHGQKPEVMVVACCDSRVDPALILQCEPGELFVVRNVASIVPPYEKDSGYHGTSAALEFGIRMLKVKHLILLGHSQCGGIQALQEGVSRGESDFINNWVSIIDDSTQIDDVDTGVKNALNISHQNCLGFPWIKQALDNNNLQLHRWFFEIKTGQIFTYSAAKNDYTPLVKEEGGI